MAVGDNYRQRALELYAQAETAKDATSRAKFESLAAAFMRLALQAERNAQLDMMPPPTEDDQKPKE
jgi:hypothetical protein